MNKIAILNKTVHFSEAIMQEQRYKLIKSSVKDEIGNRVEVYGILVNGKTQIPDISCDKTVVTDLIKRLDNENIPIKQLMYIIEDSII